MRLILIDLASDLLQYVTEQNPSPILLHSLPFDLLESEVLLLLASTRCRVTIDATTTNSIFIQLAMRKGLDLDVTSARFLSLEPMNLLYQLLKRELTLGLGNGLGCSLSIRCSRCLSGATLCNQVWRSWRVLRSLIRVGMHSLVRVLGLPKLVVFPADAHACLWIFHDEAVEPFKQLFESSFTVLEVFVSHPCFSVHSENFLYVHHLSVAIVEFTLVLLIRL